MESLVFPPQRSFEPATTLFEPWCAGDVTPYIAAWSLPVISKQHRPGRVRPELGRGG